MSEMIVMEFTMTELWSKAWGDSSGQKEGQAAMSYCSYMPGTGA